MSQQRGQAAGVGCPRLSLADDQGNHNIGFHSANVTSPHIDALQKTGRGFERPGPCSRKHVEELGVVPGEARARVIITRFQRCSDFVA